MSSSDGSIGSSSSGAMAVAFLLDAMVVQVEVGRTDTRYTGDRGEAIGCVNCSRRRTRKVATSSDRTYLVSRGLVSQEYLTPRLDHARVQDKVQQRRVRVECTLDDHCGSLCLARDCQDPVRARHSRFNFGFVDRDKNITHAPTDSTHRDCRKTRAEASAIDPKLTAAG